MHKPWILFFPILLVLSFLSFIPTSAHAQWAYTFGGTENDSISMVSQTSDGGYVVAGETNSFGPGYSNGWIIRLAGNGSVMWQKAYGSGSESIRSIAQTTDGGYVVAGSTNSSGAVNGDVWVIKLDTGGNTAWQKRYGGTGSEFARSIRQTQDGGYIVAGQTSSFGAGWVDMWIFKLDNTGNLVWQKTYGGLDYDEAYSIEQTADGGYIVAGRTSSFGAPASHYAWVLKLDESGNTAWQKRYGGTGYTSMRSVRQVPDGGYVIAGVTDSFGGENELWVLKINSSGGIQWQKRYPGLSLPADSLALTLSGTYIVAGTSDAGGTDKTALSVLNLNPDGSVMWRRTYGGASYDDARSIQQTLEGGFIVAGGTNSFGKEDEDFWVLKLDSNGSIGLCPFERTQIQIEHSTTATAEDTTATPANSQVTPADTDTAPTATDATPGIICSSSAPLTRLKAVVKKKNQGNGVITSYDGLIDCPDACEVEYTRGFHAKLTATPSRLSTFWGWQPTSLDCQGAPACQVTMDKKKSVKAVFRGPNRLKTATISRKGGSGWVTSEDEGIICPIDCEEAYKVGDSVTLTATPNLGKFTGWSGKPCKNEPSNVCTITMDKNYTVKAIFEGE